MNPLINNINKQRGTTLVVTLVMLVVLTLLVVSAIRSSSSNLRIAGNMQLQEESVFADQHATEVIISNDFWTTPAASSVSVAINSTTYTVNVKVPTCTGSKPILNSQPNIPTECISSGTAQNTGIIFASAPVAAGTSWCLSQQWEIEGTPQGSNTTLHQGVSMDVPVGTGC